MPTSTYNAWDFNSYILYMAILAIGMFFCRLSLQKSKGVLVINYKFFLSIFIPWLIILVLRDISRGNDSEVYFDLYKTLRFDSFKDAFNYEVLIQGEPFYKISNYILSLFVGDTSDAFQLASLFFLQSVLWMSFILLAFKAEIKRIGSLGLAIAFATTFVLLFAQSFNIIRNTIAMAIMFFAFTQLADGERKKYILLNLLALGFHYTAVIGFVIYFFVIDSKLQLLYRFLIILFLLVFFVYGSEMLNMLFLGMESRYSSMGTSSVEFGVGNIAKRIPFLFFVWWLKNDLIKENSHNKLYIDLIWLDMLTCSICYVNPMFNRITLYFAMAQIFLMPSLYSIMAKKTTKAAASVTFILLYFFWILHQFYAFTYGMPYQFMPYMSPYF